ncbi:MAG: class I SAM-dependent methyltransferase [Planctomycetota bacterium]
MQTVAESIYDHPTYYDLIFGSDWVAEYRFLTSVFQKHVQGKTKRLLEPACGTGRLLYRMQKGGYHCEGLDLNEKAVDFCNVRLKKHGFKPNAFVADMCDFQLKKPCDAAFNTINSFRHLTTEAMAVAHLRAMAAAIRPGGIYALGFHLTPLVGQATDEESWTARRGHLQVNTRMWPRDKNTKTRIERFFLRFDVYKPTGSLRIDDCLVLRSYTYKQFASLIKKVPEWSIETAYDFHYDIDEEIEIDGSTEDVVYILKRT